MALAALVMAGGRATRMGTGPEKPLIDVGNKPMVQRVVEALKQSHSIDRIIVAVSHRTQKTASVATSLGVEVFETPGEGYQADMQQAIRSLGLEDVVVVSADLPFLVPRIVADAIDRYMLSGKPALMVAAPIELYKKHRIEPSYTFDFNGRKLASIGLNIIDGKRINEPELEETVFVIDDEDLVFNVNTQRDLEVARSHYDHD
jgi:adenosylcobinamide-phosphate guanylyltransferase